MPWFPDFVAAVELARIQTQAAQRSDPLAEYLRALERGDSRELESDWPGEIVVHDPHAAELRGHRALRRFVRQNSSWLAERHVSTEIVAATRIDGRAVVELLAHLPPDGTELAWPVAVVAESRGDSSVEFRTYCSQVPLDGRHHVRSPVLVRGRSARARSSAGTKRRWRPVTPTQSSISSRRTGMYAGPSGLRSAGRPSCVHSSPRGSAPAAASAWSSAP